MRTIQFKCGCSITNDMFDDSYISVDPCYKHAKKMQVELKAMSDKLRRIQKGEKK